MLKIDTARVTAAMQAVDEVASTENILTAAACPAISGIDYQETWVIACMVRHERRQQWVQYIVETKLRGQPSEIATMGAFGHPENEGDDDRVPDEPRWRYYFHGRGCCLTHDDGTRIDVDFADDGSSREIDAFFYTDFLESVPQREWPEEQIYASPALAQAWQYDLQRLQDLGLLSKKHRYQLTDKGRAFGEMIETLIDAINEPSTDDRKRCYLLALIGDPGLAATYACRFEPPLSSQLQKHQRLQKEARAQRIRQQISDGVASDHQLRALAALGKQWNVHEAGQCLSSQPVTSAHHTALEIVASWNLPSGKVFGEVLELHALKPGSRSYARAEKKDEMDDRPRKYLVVKLCIEILRDQHRFQSSGHSKAQLCAILQQSYAPGDAQAGFLLYLLDTNKGLEKLKHCLKHRVPICRTEAAAFLAVLQTAPSIEVLIEQSNHPPEDGGLEAACALDFIDHPRAIEASAYWKQRFDGYEEAEGEEIDMLGKKHRVWTMDEVTRINQRAHTEYVVNEFRDQFSETIQRWHPPESSRPQA